MQQSYRRLNAVSLRCHGVAAFDGFRCAYTALPHAEAGDHCFVDLNAHTGLAGQGNEPVVDR